MAEYFDGPGYPAADHSKGADTQNSRRLEIENHNLSQQIESLKLERVHLVEDLKRANSDLLQYKDRTQALQKQVSGLKSGKYKPDQVPEFKTPNPSQQIIKALIRENEELKKRIELLKEIKDKVRTNTAEKDPSDFLDALTYLEEENMNLRQQLNLEGETSNHSLIGKESENVEITQLKERLQISLNWSRDLSDQIDILKKELESTREDRGPSMHKPVVWKDQPNEYISRAIDPPQPIYQYQQQRPMPRQPGRTMDPPPFIQYPVYNLEPSPIYPSPGHTPTLSQYAPMQLPTLPPSIIMPQGTNASHQIEQRRPTGGHSYNPQDPPLGYN